MTEMEQFDEELGRILAEFPRTKVDTQVGEWNALVKVRRAVQKVVAYRQQLQAAASPHSSGRSEHG